LNRTKLFFIGGFLCVLTSLQGLSQSTALKDSLQALIDQNPTDLAGYKYVLDLIVGAGLDKADLDTYLSLGIKFTEQLDDYQRTDTLLRYAAFQYLKLGHVEVATRIYNQLDSLGNVNDDPLLTGGALLGMSTIYEQTGKLDKAADNIKQSMVYFRSKQSHFDMANALNMLTTIYRKRGDVDQAIASADSALIYIKNIDRVSGKQRQLLVTTYSNLGNIFRSTGDNDKALHNFREAERYASEMKDKGYLGVIYNNLGNISHIRGDLEDAIDYYLKSIEIKHQHNDNRGMAVGYHNLGAIEFDLGDYEASRKYLLLSDEISQEQDLAALRVYNYNKFGSISLQQDSNARAVREYQLAYDLSDSLGFVVGKLTALQGLGESFLNIGYYEQSYDILKEGLDLAVAKGSKPNESSLLVLLANLYVQSRESNVRIGSLDNSQVEAYLNRSLTLANEMNNLDNKLATYKALGVFYNSTGRYKQSLDAYNQYRMLRDTFFDKQRIELTREMQVRYETSEKEKEIIKLAADKEIALVRNEKNRNIFISIISGLLLLLLAVIQYIRYRARIQREKEYEMFRSKLSAELHDDIGTILTGVAMHSELLSDIAHKETKMTASMIADMSRKAMVHMRDAVWAIDARKDTLGDLSDRMLDFAEDLLSSRQISIAYNAPDNSELHIRPEVRQNTYLMFKEAVTNIAKHSNATEVKVSLGVRKNCLVLDVKDNGDVAQKNTIKTSGLGLSNIRMRVDQLNGLCNITTDSGFGLHIELPL